MQCLVMTSVGVEWKQMEPGTRTPLTSTITMASTRSEDLEEERLTKRQQLTNDMGAADDLSHSPELCSLSPHMSALRCAS